ncbi:MAG TPA: hypothetical protein VHD56_17215 [Tepidisphaeraceae bacterium]|nr:hypothetical protein [Tepidisphaeraceae bacterium]
MAISSRFIATILIGLTIFMALQRLATYQAPAEWDIGMYAVIGHEINQGAHLYQDIWDMKPPAIFATYALAEHVSGYGPGQIYFLSVLTATIIMLGVYCAASTKGPIAGLWAATLWSAAAFNVAIDANLPNTEVFINALMIGALAILMRANRPRHSWLMTIIAGVLIGLASLYKTVVVAPAALLALGHILTVQKSQRRVALMQAIIMGVIGAAAWGITFGYFALTGRSAIFVATNYTYARYYGGNPAAHILESFVPANLLPPHLRSLAPLLAAGLLAPLLGPWKRPSRPAVLLILMAIGTQIAIAMPGKFWGHYYQFWLPVLAVAGGWGLLRLGELAPTRRWLRPALGFAMAGVMIAGQIHWYGLDTEQWIRQRYTADFLTCYEDAKLIDSLLLPNEKVYIWAYETWMYWIIHRPPAAAAMFKGHTLQGPIAPWLAEHTAEQLRRDPPDLIVDWPSDLVTAEHPIAKVIAELYRPAPELGARFPLEFYVRKGSRLDQPR